VNSRASFGALEVESGSGLTEWRAAPLALDWDAVTDGLEDVSKYYAAMAVLVPTYQRSGRGDRGAQAEAGEDGKEQQNCEAFDGEGHGGGIGLVSVEVWIGNEGVDVGMWCRRRRRGRRGRRSTELTL
jgi:hypothetical protein